MTFINWADPEEMFGLLSEYVADERGESRADPGRERFLGKLSESLDEVAEQFATASQREIIRKLKEIRSSQPSEFGGDPVLDHLDACIGELERINREAAVPGDAEAAPLD